MVHWRNAMKPEYWLGIGALAGAVIGFILDQVVGWVDTTTGMITGVLVGAILYQWAAKRQKPKE